MVRQIVEVPFSVTHPLGLPRPLNLTNTFGVSKSLVCDNVMPIPSGCLAVFHDEVYGPYARSILESLRKDDSGWTLAETDAPARYCFIRGGTPAVVPAGSRLTVLEPREISLREILGYLDLNHAWAPSIQLLDLVTIIKEDVSEHQWTQYERDHPWLSGVLL